MQHKNCIKFSKVFEATEELLNKIVVFRGNTFAVFVCYSVTESAETKY